VRGELLPLDLYIQDAVLELVDHYVLALVLFKDAFDLLNSLIEADVQALEVFDRFTILGLF